MALGGPGVLVAVRLTEPVPAVAVSVLTCAVSLSVHVIDAFPLASVVDVLALVAPLPTAVNQLTVTFADGCPPNSTCTLVSSEVPIRAVRSRKLESAETL
jgi:hypothetical protein